ncbi:MAG: MFS transporter [Candidatus Tectomicrobia bacterium]|nr:MFS transporter [Candidatus Tectomicrobia bacterium]
MSDAVPSLPLPAPDRYRYTIVGIGFATLAGASGVANLFSVFYTTLLDTFAWSHAAGASVYSVNMLVVALSAPVVGWLLDRFGPRWLFTTAAALIGLAFLACSRLQHLGHFMLFYGVFSALGQTALLSMTVVVARWFAHEQRGRAIGFADVGTGFGMVVMVPGSAWLIGQFGWRTAFVVLGLALIAVLVPLNLLHRPAPGTTEADRRLVSLSGLLGSRGLWLLCMAHLFMTITMTMVNVHLVEFLVSTHILRILAASTVLSAVSLVSLPGRLFFGWLADRLQPNGAFTVAMSCTMIGFVMLLVLAQLETRGPLIAFVVIYGFAQGAGGIAVAAKTVALFQGPFLGTIFMVVTLSGNLGAAFGAWFGGRLFDLSGSYTFTFMTAIISGVLAIALMWTGHASPARQQTPAERSPTG